MEKCGYLIPIGSGVSGAPEKEYIAFERFSNSKVFYKTIFEGKKSNEFYNAGIEKSDLIGLLIDENELIKSGYDVINASAQNREQYIRVIDGYNFTTKWENYIFCTNGTISEEEFNEIGEYVFVRGKIPLSYVKVFEEW